MKSQAIAVALCVALGCSSNGGTPDGGGTDAGGDAMASDGPVGGSSLIATDRRIDWSQAGVPGGIPARTTTCATLSPGVTAAAINAAIAACPAGQVVSLTAGTYDLSEAVDFNGHDDVTLRGAGPDKTFLIFSGGSSCRGQGADLCIASTNYSFYVETPTHTADWTAGYAKGSTTITLSDTTGLGVGSIMAMDQADDTTDTGQVFVCQTMGVCADETPGGSGQAGRVQEQYVKVTAINGNQVTISPGVYMPNWRASQSPHAWWGDSGSIISGDGIEDLSADHAGNTSGDKSGISLIWAHGCWLKNVRSLNANRNHVWLYQTAHSTVRDSYFYGTLNAASQSYGIESYMGADNLVENNILEHITGPLMAGGSTTGLVEAYNYSIDDYYTVSLTWMQGSNYMHAAGTDNILHEGNEGAGLTADLIHGTHDFITAFRNYFVGWETGKTAQTVPINAYSFARYFNVIGNVLGKPGYHDTYESTLPNFSNADTAIFRLADPGNLPANLADPLVKSTLMRWGNYDVVTGDTRWDATEVPSGLPQYGNPVPPDHALPLSLYLSVKPAWWPASIPWPPIGPDVTGGPGPGGHAYLIPAHACYDKTSKTNGILDFNAANCY